MSELKGNQELLARLNEKLVAVAGGCIEWQGWLNEKGYGSIHALGKNWPTHRLMWEIVHGPVPDGLLVCHSCDNACCCNIEHLWLGTNRQNQLDASDKMRFKKQQPTLQFLNKPSEPIVGRPLLMNDLFDKYDKECIPDLMERSQRDYRGILVILRQHFGHFEPKDIKPKHVAAFLDVPKGRIHRNRMVTILGTVFHKAIGKWCLGEDLVNPCTAVEKWPAKARTRYVTDEEFTAFRALCPAQIQIAMDLALLTGQRQGDIVGLTWDQVKAIGVKREDWRIEIDQGKTGKKLAIMISPALEAVLSRAKQMPPNYPHDWVIRTEHGFPYTSDGFRALWQRCCKKWESLGHERFHYHDLRAKSISDNASLDDAYLLAGHIDIAMTRKVYDRNRRKVKPLK